MATVLVVTREPPYPPNAGDRIVTHGFMRGLAARGHAVHLLSAGGDSARTGPLDALCESVACVSPAGTSLPPRLRKLRNLLVGRSDVMQMFDSAAVRTALAEAIRSTEPDVVLAEHPYIGQFFGDEAVRRAVDAAGSRLVTNAHVVEYRVHEAYSEYVGGLEGIGLDLELPRLEREELAVYEASDRTLVLGDEDGQELDGRVSGPVCRQHVGLDTDAYEPARTADADATRVVFFGSYGWFPNRDAITTFGECVFPQIREARPDAELVVAGFWTVTGTPLSMAALASSKCVPTGVATCTQSRDSSARRSSASV